MFDSLILGFHLQSIHLPDRPWMNNQNYGIYCLADNIGIGVYRNTRRKISAWAGYDVIPNSWMLGPINPSLHVGVISGYDSSTLHYIAKDGIPHTVTDLKTYRLFIAPSASFPINSSKNLFGRITVLPGVVHSQIEWSWK